MTTIDDRCGPYCELCGDCLTCYPTEPCADGRGHSWPSQSRESVTAESDPIGPLCDEDGS